jgi:hypothetical protein
MPKKNSADRIWLAPLSTEQYETINPFWAWCEAGEGVISEVVLLHDVDLSAHAESTAAAFGAVAAAYLEDTPSVRKVPFDDEDVREFRAKAESVFQDAAGSGQRLIVDISATTLNYVPVFLMDMVRSHIKTVERVLYFQYDAHRLRRIPYALIPRKGIIRHNLLDAMNRKQKGGK